ncbi:hypothetical protein H5410_047861 [Solanum commersonii]|uniref:Uncharacterized protein n=1 Tax=Solanum commersonii TaxID=4109 RepID=A0A9J5XGE4_SOLCO|nr:hypothetical protein H5410_047861 [Solanum commersonii]
MGMKDKILKHVKSKESSIPKSNLLELKPFESSRKCVEKDPFGAVSRDRRSARRSSLWSGLSTLEIRRGCRPFGDTPNGLGDR